MAISGRWRGYLVEDDVNVLHVEIELLVEVSFIRDTDIDVAHVHKTMLHN